MFGPLRREASAGLRTNARTPCPMAVSCRTSSFPLFPVAPVINIMDYLQSYRQGQYNNRAVFPTQTTCRCGIGVEPRLRAHRLSRRQYALLTVTGARLAFDRRYISSFHQAHGNCQKQSTSCFSKREVMNSKDARQRGNHGAPLRAGHPSVMHSQAGGLLAHFSAEPFRLSYTQAQQASPLPWRRTPRLESP